MTIPIITNPKIADVVEAAGEVFEYRPEVAPVPRIVELFGHETPEGKCIDGVVLSDGSKLAAEDVSPAMWAAAGIVQEDGKPLGGPTQ